MNKLLSTIALLGMLSPLSFGQTKPTDFYRPQYHFSAPKNWINDPNGLIYASGQYHLFYQYNPFANVWGHMSWGHATSQDLLHWQNQPLAIAEFTHSGGKVNTAIFSGSSVNDKSNQSGLCPTGTTDCLVAIYTGNVSQGDQQTAQYQNLAYSADKGQTWTQYVNNPVLDIGSKEFRDPSVFWYAPQKKWVMSVVQATQHQVSFYVSKDLKSWQLMSQFGKTGDTTKVWECPSLRQVPIQNEPANSKWVLFVSAGHPQKDFVGMQYFVGDFDGNQFIPDPVQPRPLANRFAGAVVDYGKDYYAAIPFNDLPDDRRGPIMIGWLNNWAYANQLPTTPFKGTYSLPRQIGLKRTASGFQLVQQPIASLTRLRGGSVTQSDIQLTDQCHLLASNWNNSYELSVDMLPGTAKSIGIRLAKNGPEETIVRYADGHLELDRRQSGDSGFSKQFPSVESAPLQAQQGVIKLRLFVDKSVVEVFANDGSCTITDLIFPTKSGGDIELFVEGGSAQFKNVTIWPMKSARKDPH